MIRVVDHAELPAPPTRVWQWFTEQMVPQYLDWHPEHVTARALTGLPLDESSVLFFDEWIGPFRLAARFRVHEMVYPSRFSYRALWPYSLINAGGSFTFHAAGNHGTRMTAEVHFGWDSPVIAPATDEAVGGLGRVWRIMRASPGWLSG